MTPGERSMVLLIVVSLRKAGYAPVAVWDGEAYNWADPQAEGGIVARHEGEPLPDELLYDLTDKQVLELVGAVDESTIHFTHQQKRTWGNRGVFIVLGNAEDGSDLPSDYHCPKEDFSTILGGLPEVAPVIPAPFVSAQHAQTLALTLGEHAREARDIATSLESMGVEDRARAELAAMALYLATRLKGLADEAEKVAIEGGAA